MPEFNQGEGVPVNSNQEQCVMGIAFSQIHPERHNRVTYAIVHVQPWSSKIPDGFSLRDRRQGI